MTTKTKTINEKKLKKEIDAAYSKYMSGIQVNIMNLSKVTNHVLTAVKEGKTIEQGFNEARDLYREN